MRHACSCSMQGPRSRKRFLLESNNCSYKVNEASPFRLGAHVWQRDVSILLMTTCHSTIMIQNGPTSLNSMRNSNYTTGDIPRLLKVEKTNECRPQTFRSKASDLICAAVSAVLQCCDGMTRLFTRLALGRQIFGPAVGELSERAALVIYFVIREGIERKRSR